MRKPPKYVKRAKMWCVCEAGIIERTRGVEKQKQEQHWFSTQEEANKFYDERI